FAREHYWVQASTAHQSGAEQRLLAADERLSVIAAEHAPEPHEPVVATSGGGEFAVHPEHSVLENLQRYLVWFLCKETGLTPDQVKPGKGLRSYGVDSITSSRLMRGFETFFQVRVTGRDLLEHHTIESLVAYLAGKVETKYVQTHTTQ